MRAVGWSIPEGLDRHLHGNAKTDKCAVMDAAWKDAREFGRERFQAARIAEERAIAERRLTEPVFMVTPDKLLFADEHTWDGGARDPASVEFAEQRLADLGFVRYQERNVSSYQRAYQEHAIIADPRTMGRIDFAVYTPKHKGKRIEWVSRGDFKLTDHTKNDLSNKLAVRIAECLARPSRARRLISNE